MDLIIWPCYPSDPMLNYSYVCTYIVQSTEEGLECVGSGPVPLMALIQHRQLDSITHQGARAMDGPCDGKNQASISDKNAAIAGTGGGPVGAGRCDTGTLICATGYRSDGFHKRGDGYPRWFWAGVMKRSQGRAEARRWYSTTTETAHSKY